MSEIDKMVDELRTRLIGLEALLCDAQTEVAAQHKRIGKLEAHIANLTRFNIPDSIKWDQASRVARRDLSERPSPPPLDE